MPHPLGAAEAGFLPDLGPGFWPMVSMGAILGGTMGSETVVPVGLLCVLPDEPLRIIVHRMARSGKTEFPVIDRSDSRRVIGRISLEDLLKARTLNLEAENIRERTMSVRDALPF